MFGEWFLVILLSIPALLFGYFRYRLVKRWFGPKKAGVAAIMLLVTFGLGLSRRREAIESVKSQNPQAFRYSSSPMIRSLFTPSAAPVSVTDNATGQEVFTYYRNDGAARLVALEQPRQGEWLATLVVNAGEPHNPKLAGTLEKPFDDDTRVLPLTKVFRSWSGDLRVEDVQTGQTLFTYAEAGKIQPVSIIKQAQSAGIYEWKVLFTNGAGLLSQQ